MRPEDDEVVEVDDVSEYVDMMTWLIWYDGLLYVCMYVFMYVEEANIRIQDLQKRILIKMDQNIKIERETRGQFVGCWAVSKL